MNKKILIVDDEKEIVDLLEVYLSNDGYSVYKCYNAYRLNAASHNILKKSGLLDR